MALAEACAAARDAELRRDWLALNRDALTVAASVLMLGRRMRSLKSLISRSRSVAPKVKPVCFWVSRVSETLVSANTAAEPPSANVAPL
jgi:hypothetical protein